MYEIILFYLVMVNVTAFCMYGIDKKRAVKDQWRIPEKTLLAAAVLGGGAGALLGMRFFHHKTRKPKFYIGVPAVLAAEGAVLVWLLAR